MFLERLNQHLAQRERGRQKLVPAGQHGLAKLYGAFRKRAVVFEKIDEDICVPENSAHSQPSRSRRTYSSACSLAQSSFPVPRSDSNESSVFAALLRADSQSRYQLKRPPYPSGKSSGAGEIFEPSRAGLYGSPLRNKRRRPDAVSYSMRCRAEFGGRF